jgi:NTE family protein
MRSRRPLRSRIRRALGACADTGLALQGGGSHGAYTWGILDRLLEEPAIEIGALSGTSAGAMNAAACATGLMRAGREGAREALAAFWKAVAKAAGNSSLPPSLWELVLGDEGVEPSASMHSLLALTRVFSPYELNPLNINPLNEVVESEIDFEMLRYYNYPRLYVTATNVHTGTQRVFSNAEIGPPQLLASACLPTMHHAVEIDGEPYWDGGYTGNPVVYPLVEGARCADVLVLLLSPLRREDSVRTAKEILSRATEISFNAAFLREMQWLAKHQARGGALGRATRFHLFTPGEELYKLSQLSKLNTEWEFLNKLHEQGREAADQWLKDHRGAIGRRSSVDLTTTFGCA